MFATLDLPFFSILNSVKKILSVKYDDRPMPDGVYEFHANWIKVLHDYYLRTEHVGHVQECLELARKEHVIFISNHAITVEAVLLGYFLLKEKAGKIGTLVYPEAFKLPLIREFFRSVQCVPISVEAGVATLKKRHLLVFPEGMDFIAGMVNPQRVPRFHKGFLRMAKTYLEETGHDSVRIIPIGHVGIEKTFKFWVIRNEKLLDTLVRPFASYPFFVLPKLPLLFPSKVVMNWGLPHKIPLDDLKKDRKMSQMANHFRSNLLALKNRAQKLKGMSVF